MKRKLMKLLSGLLICTLLLSSAIAVNPAREGMRAMWVATVYNLDYPSKSTVNPAKLKAEADAILKGCVDMGMNTVILQVRPSADAFYPSALFPWSEYLTGTQGTAPTGGFDPLAYWIERAHALGLELHAWVNPFRITKGGAAEFATLAPSNPAKLHPQWVVEYKENYYLNPGLPEVRELVIQGAEELARGYALDGIHMDDYFYPGTGFDDAMTFAQYGQGFSSRDDWRRDNVNQLVKTMGERVHAIRPDLSYGISPAGVWAESGKIAGGSQTTGGYESYFSSFADSRKWVKEGWIDYICPQIYWQIGHPKADYQTLAHWWADTVRGTGVRLYIGMADYMAGNASPTSPWYGTTAIQQQLALNKTIPEISGEVHFRYRLMAANAGLVSLYSTWYGQSGSPAPVPTATPTPAPTPIPTPSPTPDPAERPKLDTVGHGAYLQGSGGRFRPNDKLSRAEAVALLARLSVDEEGESLYTGAPYQGGFQDVDATQWYAPYVSFAQQYGVVSGYLDGTFRPTAAMTRSELVKILSGYFDVPESATSAFRDVPADHWAADVIAYAAGAGWVNGFEDGTFQPDRAVTRAEAARIINGALGRQPDRTWIDGAADLSSFADVTPDHWAYYEILEASHTHGYEVTDGVEVWTGDR